MGKFEAGYSVVARMKTWITEEYKNLNLGDKRLDKRCRAIVKMRSESPGSSIPKASMGNRAEMKATYRFLDNDMVTAQGLMQPHIDNTLARCKDIDYVLVAHDTTNINLHGSPLDLGHIDNGTTNGVMMHSAMAISPSGLTLGLLYQKVWGRDRELHGQSNYSFRRPYEKKESYKWEEGINNCIKNLGDKRAIHICDREADIYETLSMKRPAHHHLLVRYRHSRTTTEGQKVIEKLKEQTEACRYTVSVVRGENRSPESVILSIKFCKVEIKKPSGKKGENLQMNAVMAEEVSENVEQLSEGDTTIGSPGKILWILYTDIEVENAEKARWVVLLYTFRWLIERFHFVLKSGCGVEKLQLRNSFEQIHRALALLSVIAWRLMHLAYVARTEAEMPADDFLEKDEWEALCWWKHKTFDIQSEPPSIGEAVRWIAMLGGYIGRNNDGPPGTKTLWQGYLLLTEKAKDWRKFKDYLSTYQPP